MGSEGLKRKSIEIFAGLAASYERTLDLATLYQDRRWKDWIARRLRPEGLVLDIGAGTLVLEDRMAKLGTEFVGLDLSSEMVRVARAKAVPNVPLLTNADAEFLPFADSSFDSVVGCYVPKYVDPNAFAGELARVSRPGADVLLYDFVRPRGAAAPILQAYIQGGLRAVGLGLELAGRGESTTFSDLPGIIAGSRWELELPPAMERSGFRLVETAWLTGGVVFACWGRKEGGNISGVQPPCDRDT